MNLIFSSKFSEILLFRVLGYICLFCFFNLNASNAKDLAERDWVDNPLQKCGGYFENPINELINFDFKNNALEASADKTSLGEEKIIFHGNVTINHRNIYARSDVANYDSSKETLELNENIIIRTPKVAVGGNTAKINLTNQIAKINKANYVIHPYHAHGTANEIKVNQKDNIILISNGDYSLCPPKNKFWEIGAREIKLDNNISQGTIKNATLKIKNNPILFVPYVRFPIGEKRQSGFLSPVLSKNSKGIDISLPYYFDIAPNLDLIFSPRYNSNFGIINEVKARALTRFDNWKVHSAYLNNDRQQQGLSNEERWLLQIKENGAWSKNLYSKIDFTKVSDINYLQDLNSNNLNISRKSHINQYASLNYYSKNIEAGISFRNYQKLFVNQTSNLSTEKLPSWFFEYESNNLYFKPNYYFQVRQNSFSRDGIDDSFRNFSEVSINFPMEWHGLELIPDIGMEYLSYENNSTTFSNGEKKYSLSSTRKQLELNLAFIKRAINLELVDVKLFYVNRESNQDSILGDEYHFDREYSNFNTNYFSSHTPYSGYDINLNSHFVSALISHNLQRPSKTLNVLTRLGQIHYLDNEKPIWIDDNDNQSPIYTELELTKGKNLKVFASSNIDNKNKKIQEGHFILNYKNNEIKPTNFNIRYHYRKMNLDNSVFNPEIDQTDLSFMGPINSKWSLMGKYSYDNNLKRKNEVLTGLSFKDCCFSFSIIYRDAILKSFNINDTPSTDKSIYFQFELNGLFGLGGNIDNIISKSFDGFNEHNLNYF